MAQNKIISVILAAGLSSRMNEKSTKCMKKIDDTETIIQRLIRQQTDLLSVSNVFISTGYQSQKYDFLNSETIKTVNNVDFKKDKNINSCFLCIEEIFEKKIDFDYLLITEGDVIISDKDIDVLKEATSDITQDNFVFVERLSRSNKNRVGCVTEQNELYLRQSESLDDRMTGVFLLNKATAQDLMINQKRTIEKYGMQHYYFYPLLKINDLFKCKSNFRKLYFNSSFTVNNKKEYEWAKKNIKK